MAKLFVALSIFFVLVNAAKDYGYFDYKMQYVTSCQGPKRKDCCTSILTINNSFIMFDIDCKETVSPTKGKIVAFKNKQKVRLQMDKPCQHVFIKPIINELFNTTNCVILKNRYRISLDIVDVANKYYNGMFIYGNWTFQSMFFSDTCNFLCMNLRVGIEPKNNK